MAAPGGARLVASSGLVLLLLTAVHAFQWTSGIQNGGKLQRCVGDNVTFPWSYVTESKENVIVHFWFSNKSGSFANYLADNFSTSWDRVTQAGTAGVTLYNVSTADDDTYWVSVMLPDRQEPLTQHITLTVAEPPRTTDGQLHVIEHIKISTGTKNTSSPHMRLKCGDFLTRGSPPVSVVWTDPSGRRTSSTSFHDGYFHLDLDLHARGGNYTCSMQPEAEAVQCLANDSPLLAAGYLLVTMETAVLGAEMQQLRRTLEELSQQVALSHVTHTNTSGALWHTVTLQQEQTNRTDALEGQVEELHNTDVRQNWTVSVLVNQVADLQDTSKELQKKNADLSQTFRDQSEQIFSLQKQLSALHSTVLELRQDQNTQVSVLQKQSPDQNTQISDLQNQTTDQNTQIPGLQKQVSDQNAEISSLQEQVSDQIAQISSLQKQVSDHNTHIYGLQKQNSGQNTQIYDQQNQNTNQSTQISGLQKQVSDQNAQIDGLQKQVSDQNTQISGLQNQHTNQSTQISGLQKQVTDQNTEISTLRSDLQKVDSDLKKADADVDLKLDDLARNLTLVTSQLTDKATLLQDRHSQLKASQDKLASGIQAGTRQMTSLQNRVTALQADVSRGQTTLRMFQSDLTKLKFSQVSKVYTNVAAFRPATQSSTDSYLKLYADRAVDLNLNTNLNQGESCTHTSPRDGNPWWRVDLGQAYDVTVVLITNRGDCCANRLKNFYVDVLNDDPDTNPRAKAVTCFHYKGVAGNGVTLALQCSKPTRGRYVRVRKSTKILHVCEVQVMAPVASVTP